MRIMNDDLMLDGDVAVTMKQSMANQKTKNRGLWFHRTFFRQNHLVFIEKRLRAFHFPYVSRRYGAANRLQFA